MAEDQLQFYFGEKSYQIPVFQIHTIVLGSGAAGLNAAAQLYLNGVKDLLVLTEGLTKGTSINAGSDKQTYYKMSLSGRDADSPADMAETLFANGSMHGDLALIEASLSVRSFINLVNLGIPFPHDEYGQFVGYKTDHDPRQRATSIGPYTSKEMCLRMINQLKGFGIEIREGRYAIELITVSKDSPRIAGLITLNKAGKFEAYICENLIFAVGGPGGLYRTSVYPSVQSGAIGLALMAGAKAANLPESQYGLVSTKFRWNVSGTYMQVVPRFISRSSDGVSDEIEFLSPFFKSASEMNGMIFLKGYQWPFDARKAIGGSSLIDILVYIETIIKGRRVFLDYRSNSSNYSLVDLPDYARVYLEKSGAFQSTPIERLFHMNPGAVELYQSHMIDLHTEPLEIAVCAQHNNGGLAGNIWYESVNLKHLFPIGEVNGAHGVTRPGGASLNGGQVGGIRAAEFIAHRYADWSLSIEEAKKAAITCIQRVIEWAELCSSADTSWRDELHTFRERMSQSGSHIRSKQALQRAVPEAWDQVQRIHQKGCKAVRKEQLKHAFRVRQLAFAQAVYLDAINFALSSGVGSRGSAIVLDPDGESVHPLLDQSWKIAPEDPVFRTQILETSYFEETGITHQWIPCRPIPESDAWFETTWARFRTGEIYFR